MGQESELAELCSEHADLAEELRQLYAEWARMSEVLDRLGPKEGTLSLQLRERYGDSVDPEISLSGLEEEGELKESSSALMSKLSSQGGSERYKARDEIARGGMGAILRVWDEDLRRPLAMKVALRGDGETKGAASDEHSQRRLSRFLEEAQITSQLDHPGIVPVHDLGIDPEGRVYFTMQLVDGRDMRDIIALAERGELRVRVRVGTADQILRTRTLTGAVEVIQTAWRARRGDKREVAAAEAAANAAAAARPPAPMAAPAPPAPPSSSLPAPPAPPAAWLAKAKKASSTTTRDARGRPEWDSEPAPAPNTHPPPAGLAAVGSSPVASRTNDPPSRDFDSSDFEARLAAAMAAAERGGGLADAAAAFRGASRVANSPPERKGRGGARAGGDGTGAGGRLALREEARRQGVTVAQLMHAREHADTSPLTKVRF